MQDSQGGVEGLEGTKQEIVVEMGYGRQKDVILSNPERSIWPSLGGHLCSLDAGVCSINRDVKQKQDLRPLRGVLQGRPYPTNDFNCRLVIALITKEDGPLGPLQWSPAGQRLRS